MPDDAHPAGIELNIGLPTSQQVVEQKPGVRHAVHYPKIHSRESLLFGLILLTREPVRIDDFGVIHSRDNITMAAQMGAQERSAPTFPSAWMRVHNERALPETRQPRIPDLTGKPAIPHVIKGFNREGIHVEHAGSEGVVFDSIQHRQLAG